MIVHDVLHIKSGARLTSSRMKSILDFIVGDIEMGWIQSTIFVKQSVHAKIKR